MKTPSALFALTLLGSACQSGGPPVEQRATVSIPAPGIDISQLDSSVRPQDDFWRYVNGAWIASTEIPADKSSWGSFAMLAEKSRQDVHGIISDLAAAEHLAPGSPEQKVRDLYQSYMDTKRIESLGVAPIRATLSTIDALGSKEELAAFFGQASRVGTSSPLGGFVNQDSKRPTEYIVYLSQSGLGLPDRDYYFREGDDAENVRSAYLTYATRLFELAGDSDPAGSAQAAYDIETALAKEQWTRVENRDRDKTYNRLDTASVKALAPGFPWDALLGSAGLAGQSAFVLRQPTYLEGFNRVFADTPLAPWKDYMKLRVLDSTAGLLNEDFYNARFAFRNKTLYGQEVPEDRWKRGVSLVNRQMGALVGQEYVKRHFPPAAKARMEELVGNLRKSLAKSIDELDWMAPETKAQAQDKLAKFTPKIGYPDRWRDYTGLDIRPDDLVGNIQRVNAFDYEYQLGKLGGPIRKWEWFMSPQTVNAYYNPQLNEIVFPAAILQPPFFSLEADDAVNYGGIGAVIGHEMGHGFDDQGRKSDGDGMLRNWWTDADATEYDKRAAKLSAQYDAFFPLPDMHINGDLTMGENIGDMNGLTLAWRAYQMSLDGNPAPKIDGLTGNQRFFISFAQIWRAKMRDAGLRQQIQTNPHSPAEFRLTGSVRNFTPFYLTFGVHRGDKMWRDPADRVEIF